LQAKWLQILALGTATVGLAWISTTSILAGESGALFWMGLEIAILVITVLTLDSWRFGFYLFLVLLLFDDLARKYMGNNMAIYFGKDLLVGIIYASIIFARKRGEALRFRPLFLVPLMLFFGLGVIQAFNPLSPSPFYGILGLKLYFYYVPLIYVGY